MDNTFKSTFAGSALGVGLIALLTSGGIFAFKKFGEKTRITRKLTDDILKERENVKVCEMTAKRLKDEYEEIVSYIMENATNSAIKKFDPIVWNDKKNVASAAWGQAEVNLKLAKARLETLLEIMEGEYDE